MGKFLDILGNPKHEHDGYLKTFVPRSNYPGSCVDESDAIRMLTGIVHTLGGSKLDISVVNVAGELIYRTLMAERMNVAAVPT